MLTTEQIAAIRERHMRMNGYVPAIGDGDRLKIWRHLLIDDIPALLDALMEAAADKKIQETDHELLIQVIARNDEHMDDRNRWRARAEMLERALRAMPCATCLYWKDHLKCNDCVDGKNWQFDEARFTGGAMSC